MQREGDKVSKITNVKVNLGPRMLRVGSKALGTCDNISIHVAEATTEELQKLKSAEVLVLVKMRGRS